MYLIMILIGNLGTIDAKYLVVIFLRWTHKKTPNSWIVYIISSCVLFQYKDSLSRYRNSHCNDERLRYGMPFVSCCLMEPDQNVNQWRHIINRPISQIPWCTASISHKAPLGTEMCTFLFWMMHCGIWNCRIVVFVNLTPRNIFQWNFIQNSHISILENAF